MKYRKKNSEVEAYQWFKNGDHPQDYEKDYEKDIVDHLIEDGTTKTYTAAYRKKNNWEGDVVRYFRSPFIPGSSFCIYCNKKYHDHGWLENKTYHDYGALVCPGDYIISDPTHGFLVCGKNEFEKTYDLIKDCIEHVSYPPFNMEEKDLMNMELHEEISFSDHGDYVMRVLGGWIYTCSGPKGISSCFVPEPKSSKDPEINEINKKIGDLKGE